jgi:hypothetical protein
MANEKGDNTQPRERRATSIGTFGEAFTEGHMVATVYLNYMAWGEVTFKATLHRKLPDGYDKSQGESIREEDLNDAMRALYRAQRWIKNRRRRLRLWRGVIFRLP